MREDKIRFQSGEWGMEGLYHCDKPIKGAVITHPHPLYGGDMFNPVVEAIVAAYQKSGFATLRFNFRGTGRSTGSYDQGIGEQADVAGAVDFLKGEGLQEIHLSGYSFGAWVNAMALQGALSVQGLTMVAPPVAFIDFNDGIRLPMLSAVVAGSRDEFAPPDLIRPLMGHWNPDARIDIIEGADHFFFGFLDEVSRRLVQRIQ
ncbi:MAG: alpha/beta fold hydrolase [Desulfosarcina sp.]|nr:alpha/beta fold hydrolase [Desulfosarcina sp.]MBC2743228.1 alpha/beta fold hydrolase [Desulfosarcina sp.]MBC2766139.1 alpha/beta fold hydrolase [Desulfosarcina sp.]